MKGNSTDNLLSYTYVCLSCFGRSLVCFPPIHVFLEAGEYEVFFIIFMSIMKVKSFSGTTSLNWVIIFVLYSPFTEEGHIGYFIPRINACETVEHS